MVYPRSEEKERYCSQLYRPGYRKPLSRFFNEFGVIRTIPISNFIVLSAAAQKRYNIVDRIILSCCGVK